MEKLLEDFDSHLEKKVFIFADECNFSRVDDGILKSIITDQLTTYMPKGVDRKNGVNFKKMLIASNDDHVVKMSNDERRYFVLRVSNEMIGNEKYFNQMNNNLLDPDVQAGFVYEMLNRDISDFNPSKFPTTDAMIEQREASLSTLGQWLRHYLLHTRVWQEEVKAVELYGSYSHFCQSLGSGVKPENTTAFGRYLTNLNFPIKRNMHGITRVLGTLENAKNAFERYEKVPL